MGTSKAKSDDLIQTMLDLITEKIENLRKNIQTGQVTCKYVVAHVSLQNKDQKTLDYIKGLKAYQIDWSNIGDYFTNKDFVNIAKQCSVEDTAHNAHFMNWSQHVFGTCLYDYVDQMQDRYN